MELSSSLLKEFAEETNDSEEITSKSTAYGTIVVSGARTYVQLDGSDQLTAISEGTEVQAGDRVIVTIENHVATVTTNLSVPATGRITQTMIDEGMIYGYFDVLEAQFATIGSLEATYIYAEEIDAKLGSFEELAADFATIEYLEATFATIENLNASVASINELFADYAQIINADIQNLYAATANIDDLTAKVAAIEEAYVTYEEVNTLIAESAGILYAYIETLNSDVANITNLLAGEVGVGDLQSIHLTADNAVIDTALIMDALIGTVLADIINANTIYTDEITIMSEDGGIYISGNQMQFSNGQIQFYDDNGVCRLQIGQDTSGNFTFVLYDETGTGIMIDSEGIHESAVPDGLIVDSMVAEDANISGYKINMEEVVSIINESGDLILDASQVIIDGERLDYKLTEIAESALQQVINYYAIGPSPYEPPCEPGDETIYDAICGIAICGLSNVNTIGWTTTHLYSQSDDEYVWYVQKIVYADGTVKWTKPTCLTDGYLRTEVSTLTTELSVVQGQISAKIWMTDIEDVYTVLGDQITTINEQFGELTITIDGINERVGILTTASDYFYSSISEINVEIGSITARVSEAEVDLDDLYERYAEIVIELDSISLTVYDSENGFAFIQMTVGDNTSEVEVVTEARKAFAASTSSIIIGAGTVEFDSNTLLIYSSQFTLDANGNATFSGNLNAASGSFSGTIYAAAGGTIGGFTIGSSSLYTNNNSLGSGSTNVYIGNDGISLGTTFEVDRSGYLTCTSGKIGGFTIGSSSLYNGPSSTSSSTSGICVSTNGIRINASDGSYIQLDQSSMQRVGSDNCVVSISNTGSTIWGYTSYSSGKMQYYVDVDFGFFGGHFTSSTNEVASFELRSQTNGGVLDICNSNGATSIELLGSSGNINASGRLTLETTNGTGIYYDYTGSSSTACQIRILQEWSGEEISLHIGNGGANRGIYDNNESEWILYKDTNDYVHVMGSGGRVYIEGTAWGPNDSAYFSEFRAYDDIYISTSGDSYTNPSSASPNVRLANGSSWSRLCLTTGSSIRYKNLVQDISNSDVSKLFEIPVVWFKYKDNYLSDEDERYEKEIPGFVTENWEDVLPIAVDHNIDGSPEMWNSNIVIPLTFAMVKYNHELILNVEDSIDNLQLQIDDLKAENKALKEELAAIKVA